MVVVDTNVLAYLLIEGDRTSEAQALFAQDSDWRSEARHRFYRRVRQYEQDAEVCWI